MLDNLAIRASDDILVDIVMNINEIKIDRKSQMLLDPKLADRSSDNPEIDKLWKILVPPVRLTKGVWSCNSWNIDFVREQFIDKHPEFNPKMEIVKRQWNKRHPEFLDPTSSVSPLTMWHLHKKPLRKKDAEFNDGQENILMSSYGVCDDYQQVLDLYDFERDPRLLFISMVEVRREDEPEHGGWRYDKWGQYLGTQKPQYEYLYDDKHIDAVWTFSIHEIKEL